MSSINEQLSSEIFRHGDYRSFLKLVVDYWQSNGLGSVRELTKILGFTSPSLISEMIAGRRALTKVNAERLARGLNLSFAATRYLDCLVTITHGRSAASRNEALAELARVIGFAGRALTADPSIHDSWLHAVIFEMAKTKDFRSDVESIRQKLRFNVPRADIESSLAYLEQKKYLEATMSATVNLANVEFKVINDLKRLNVQKKHLQFLQVAQHRLTDDLEEREFQGLTVAIRSEAMPILKQRLRRFITEINDEIAESAGADHVVRIQMCAFKLTK